MNSSCPSCLRGELNQSVSLPMQARTVYQEALVIGKEAHLKDTGGSIPKPCA